MYRFDLERWPIVLVEQRGDHSESDFEGYLRHLERLIRTGGPYAMIDDITGQSLMPDVGRLRAFARWYDQHRVEGERACVISVSVIPNAAVRGASKFFIRLAGVTVDTRVTETVGEALALCTQAFAKRGLPSTGVPLPSTLIGLR